MKSGANTNRVRSQNLGCTPDQERTNTRAAPGAEVAPDTHAGAQRPDLDCAPNEAHREVGREERQEAMNTKAVKMPEVYLKKPEQRNEIVADVQVGIALLDIVVDSRDLTTYVRKDARVYPKSAPLRWGISLQLCERAESTYLRARHHLDELPPHLKGTFAAKVNRSARRNGPTPASEHSQRPD